MSIIAVQTEKGIHCSCNMNSIISSSCNKCNKVFDKSMPTCGCHGVPTININSIPMSGWSNGFNDPPKGYVAPTAEEIKKTFLEKLQETGQLEKLNISIDGDQEPITSPNMFPNPPGVQPAPTELRQAFTKVREKSQQVQQGWECPRCNEINAPFVSKCGCK